ncbi:MAG: RNA polymerase sigma factor [Bacteroidota bacterium]
MQLSDQNIIQGCQKGDRQAQQQLYQKYKAMLFGVCLRYARSRAEAEDYLQEGFIRIYRDLYQYRPTKALGAWLRRVMVNSCLRQIQKHKNIFQEVDWNQISVSYEMEYREETDDRAKYLIAMIQQMPAGYRAVFNMYVIEGYTHAEIAEYLGISINTSKSQLSRAKVLLKKLFEKNMNAC